MENRIVSNVLQKNSDFLSRHLVLSPTVLEKLQENGLISEYVKRQLAFKDTDEQVPCLIESFSDRGLLTFRKFLAVLRETGHGWLVDVLLRSQALSYEEIASTDGQAGQVDFRQGSGLVGERSRLHGMTPEHARMRLTSAHLRGRGGDVGGGYGDVGLGLRGVERGGLGDEGYHGTGFGSGGYERSGLVGGGFERSGSGRERGGFVLGGGRLAIGDRTSGCGYDRSQFSLLQNKTPPANLGSVLSDSRRVVGSGRFRGQVAPGALFSDGMRDPPRGPPLDMAGVSTGDIPGALLNLHDHFRNQSDTNEQNLTILKREEIAIKELLDQNNREQVKVRRNQGALTDIGRRLEEINVRTNEVYDPNVHNQISRYRLTQLNQIPWSNSR
ncbi:uncharacterized protein [Haliotis cracherodii]|uniref:uncharacterized protein n=1 Tax=Haliotis cracherodii TaxID=6455 RepID=UPI0039EB97E7